MPPTEGLFKAELVCVGKISETRAELRGEFRNININPKVIKTSFGRMEHCENIKHRTFKFYNTGTLNDTLAVSMIPPAGFYYADKKTLIIPANDSAEITISFDPATAPDGKSDFVVYLQSIVCDFFHTSIMLDGTLITPEISALPNPVEFKNIWPGDSSHKQLLITNNTEFDIDINTLTFSTNPNQYILKKKLPFTIKSDSSENIDITFVGMKSGTYTDTLFINYTGKCHYDTLVLIKSSVSDEVYKINLSIPDYEAQPYQTLPVSIYLDKPVYKLYCDSITIDLEWDLWLYQTTNAYFVSDSNLFKIYAELGPGYAHLTIPKQFADTAFLTAGEKIRILGSTYPSSPKYTSLTFKNIKIYSDKSTEVSSKNGSLEINPVCEPTGRLHLILSDKITVKLKKSIFSQAELNLDVHSSGNTTGKISIYTSTGNVIYSGSADFVRGQNQWHINLHNIADGTYYFILYGSTGQTFTDKFIILR